MTIARSLFPLEDPLEHPLERSANLLTAKNFLEGRPKEDRLSPGRLNRHRAMEFQGPCHAVDQQIATEVALVQAVPDRDETQGFLRRNVV